MKPGKRSLGPATCLVESSNVVRRALRDSLREVSFVHVPPEHRRQGYGSALMQALLLEADEAGMTLFVGVAPYDTRKDDMDQAGLREWYASFGFTEFQADPLLMARTPQRIAPVVEAPRILVAQ